MYPTAGAGAENGVGTRAGGAVTRARSRRALGDVTNVFARRAGGLADKPRRGVGLAPPAVEARRQEPMADITPARRERRRLEVDEADAGNPQCFTDYVNDIYDHFRAVEEEKMPMSTYMEMQTDLNEHMRAILVDWLVEVHAKFKLRPETLYLTINVIDRFLERKLVIRQKLQLVGVAAMLIASKYEEIYAPEVRDFVYITDRAYTKEQILHMEACILNALQFRVSTPTSYVFLQRYVRVAQADRKTRYIAHYCLERCLQEFGALRFRPSLQAAAACNIALRTSRGADAWSEVMASYSGYTEAELTECIRLMERGVTEESDLQAVKKKYRSRKLEEASRSHIAALP